MTIDIPAGHAKPDALIHLLDAEIADQRSDEARNGWTVLALCVALATTLSLTADVWEQNRIDSYTVAKVIVTAYFLVRFVRSSVVPALNLVSSLAEDIPVGRIHWTGNVDVVAHKRIQNVFAAIFFIILWWVALYGYSGVSTGAQRCTTFLCGLGVVGSILGLVDSYRSKPIHSSPEVSSKKAVVLVVLLFLLPVSILSLGLNGYVLVSYARTIQPVVSGVHSPDIRLGILLLFATGIAYTICGLIQKSFDTRRLTQIRRDLLLGTLAYDQALNQSEAILVGASSSLTTSD